MYVQWLTGRFSLPQGKSTRRPSFFSKKLAGFEGFVASVHNVNPTASSMTVLRRPRMSRHESDTAPATQTLTIFRIPKQDIGAQAKPAAALNPIACSSNADPPNK